MKRYVAIVDFYIWAESDSEAKEKAEKFCKKQSEKKDNSCELKELHLQEVGKLGSILIYP